jgi:hypothetical protein
MVYFDCGPVCDTPGIACMEVDTIMTCDSDPGVPFQSCGYLYQGPLCLLFRPDYFPDTVIGYRLENYESFISGDTVFVDGWLEEYYLDDCHNVTHIVADNIISLCDSLPPDTTYYYGCGVLWDDTGCVRFHPYNASFPPAVLTDYGTFHEGDEVFVSGMLIFDCNHPCAYGPYTCLDNDTITTCGSDPGEPYEACGALWTVDSCLLFHPLTPDTMWYAPIGPYELTNYGSYGLGDTVYVNGTLFSSCTSGCPGAAGCVIGNTIGECDNQPPDTTIYGGCGVLIEDSLGCIWFYPMGGLIPPLLLLDYGSFIDGDTVMVEGILDLTGGCECLGVLLPCLDNYLISTCGNQPPDSFYFAGCGILVDDTGCILFYSGIDSIPPALLTDYGPFTLGDSVYVDGWLNIAEGCQCYTITYPCIHNTNIDSCGGSGNDTISVCGVLIEGSNCIILEELHPDSGFAYMAYLLENYGTFGVGDTVRATGILRVSHPPTICPEAQLRIIENTIELCNGNAPAISRIGDITQLQIYPNPFNPVVTISFSLPAATNVSLKIYNILGQEVEALVNNQLLEGDQSYEWDGERFGSGIYFYRLNTDNVKKTGKMILTK